MMQSIQDSLPLAFNKYLAITAFKRLSTRMRINFDADTYVIRSTDYYVAYRTWMKIFPIIEVFYPGQEAVLVDWLERFGYVFESEMFKPWLSQSVNEQVAKLD